jgi:hypothetical protein
MLKADRDAGSNSQAHRVIARLTVKAQSRLAATARRKPSRR